MARRKYHKSRQSTVSSTAKRYATYRVMRGVEKGVGSATKGILSIVFGTIKVLLLICVILIVGYCAVIALPIALAVVVVGVVVVVIIKRKSKAAAVTTVESDKAKVEDSPQRQVVLREIQIMNESMALVNDSADFGVVASRYKLLIEKLNLLSTYSSEELANYGISLPVSFQEQRQIIEANRIVIFNQAIDRSLQKEKEHINSLKTDSGKSKALVRFYNDISNVIRDNGLPTECQSHLETVCRAT